MNQLLHDPAFLGQLIQTFAITLVGIVGAYVAKMVNRSSLDDKAKVAINAGANSLFVGLSDDVRQALSDDGKISTAEWLKIRNDALANAMVFAKMHGIDLAASYARPLAESLMDRALGKIIETHPLSPAPTPVVDVSQLPSSITINGKTNP